MIEARPETDGRLGSADPLVVVAGNPNTGKSTLFNQLTGSDQRVGNYPGVTVERSVGLLALPDGRSVRVMDVPGTYSLAARSEDEQIAIRAVAGLPPNEEPGLAVVVVDATQLARNLYLVLQLIETQIPVVVAVNMIDMLADDGRELDLPALRDALGVPVVAVSALKRRGLDELREAIASTLADPALGTPGWRWKPQPGELSEDVRAVAAALPGSWAADDGDRRNALALWAMLSIDDDDELVGIPDTLREAVGARRAAASQNGRQLEAEIIRGRYSWIDRHARDFVKGPQNGRRRLTERVDGLLLHPFLGFTLFLTVMGVVFQALFSWADPAIGWIEAGFEALGTGVSAVVPAGIFQDFLVEGLIAGVGSVLVFLPQILMLFFFIGLMEDSGYMARVAFLMDRIMKRLGLHGRAFVPMLSGFACAVPAILATRTMERKRDRMLTMMVVPLMTCSARLPVYSLLIAALFPPMHLFGLFPVQGLLMVGLYAFSTATALIAAAVLGRTLFKGPRVPLILELPPYRVPHWSSVVRMMWFKSRIFLTEAGTVILVCTVVLWLLLSFPKTTSQTELFAQQRAQVVETVALDAQPARLTEIDREEEGLRLRESFGGRLGHWIEPTIAPLGFDWKIGVGLVGAFAAREVFVSTMGVVYGLGAEEDEESVTLRDRIRAESYADGRPVYTPLVGLSLMVFFALACQCMSTLAAVRRETKTWRWPVFLFTYMTALAWILSFAIYQGGRLLGFE